MHEFIFRRPKTLSEALSLFAAAEEPRYLAGGQSLIPMLKHRLAQADVVIDLSALGLNGIELRDGAAEIGALATHASVAACSPLGVLAELAAGIGDAQVRHMGTIGGSLAHADPAADYPAAMLALGATIHTDRRAIAADHFFQDMFETALQPGEIITRVSVPLAAVAAWRKETSPASRYALVGVMAARRDGAWRIAVTGAGPCAFRWTAAEDALGRGEDPAAAELDIDRFNADLHATAEYRAELVRVLTRRAVAGI